MGVVKRKGLEQKDKHNWKVLLPRNTDQDRKLWYLFKGVEVKLVGSFVRQGCWYYEYRVGDRYEEVRCVDFNFEATPKY
jgi:hypothetical protein